MLIEEKIRINLFFICNESSTRWQNKPYKSGKNKMKKPLAELKSSFLDFSID